RIQQENRGPRGENLFTRSGNEIASPASGKYIRCSKITSAIGAKLDVGESVTKNQKIENAKIGARSRSRHPRIPNANRRTTENRTAGSAMPAEGLKSESRFKPKGRNVS